MEAMVFQERLPLSQVSIDFFSNVPGMLTCPITDLPTNGASSPSPGKRKRGRPRKIREPTTSPPSLPSPDQAGLSNGHPSSSTDVIVTGHRLNPNLPSHPYFSRTVSSSSKGASYDPIDVESPVRAGPRKLIFASDQKAAHSFFAAPHEVIAPVEVAVKGKAAKVYAFFEASDAKADSQGRIRDGWGRGLKEGGEWAAPWTGGIWPSHEGVSGPSSVSHCLKKATKHSKIRSRSDSSGKDYWEGIFRQALLLSRNGVSNSPHRSPQSLPPLCAQHPAWTSLRHKTGSVNRDSWCERYRPHRAEEVLGNEIEATYLRDWLRALQVGRGRKVVRKLKRPKRQLFDERVTDDIGLFGDADEEEDEDELPEAFEEPELPLGERPNGYPPLATRLTNTILLTGPHGSGKSAAVYAAATELGWEVFEVYPGIGKRTGANLMTLVGDVGKNHMVVKGGLKEETDRNGAKRTFFDKAKEGEADLANGIQGSTTGLAAVGPDDKKGSDEAEVRQSLILIDEVDILFAEENTFWPAVLALIAESRRPVVLTCNGERLCLRLIQSDGMKIRN